MKTLYVVYDCDDRPRGEYESLVDAYWWAMECGNNHWYPVWIDKFERPDRVKIKWHCENNDLWFTDEDWDWFGLDCVKDAWIIWYGLISAETKEELQKFDTICLTCDLSFNRETRWKHRKLTR